MEKKYVRKVQTAVNVFINCGNEYLMLKRSENKKVDPGRLNGIGGRLESGENFLDACIREVWEETDYKITSNNLKFSGVIRIEGGYSEDWLMCFFKCRIENKEIPKGNNTEDGKLLWINKDKVLDSEYDLIDDLKYTWKDILAEKIFFANAKFNKSGKLESISISKL